MNVLYERACAPTSPAPPPKDGLKSIIDHLARRAGALTRQRERTFVCLSDASNASLLTALARTHTQSDNLNCPLVDANDNCVCVCIYCGRLWLMASIQLPARSHNKLSCLLRRSLTTGSNLKILVFSHTHNVLQFSPKRTHTRTFKLFNVPLDWSPKIIGPTPWRVARARALVQLASFQMLNERACA